VPVLNTRLIRLNVNPFERLNQLTD